MNKDISGFPDISDYYNSSLIKKWIKLITIDKTISYSTYTRKDYFIPVANVVLDNEKCISGNKKGLQLLSNSYKSFIVS